MDTTKPTVDERYTRASNSRNLTVKEIHSGDADVLIAAGWSKSRIGAALLRLHSEWDSAEKPRLSREVAKDQAREWLLHEQGMLLGKLKSLPNVRHLVIDHCTRKWNWDRAESKAPAVLLWWLDSTCPDCHGTRYEVIQGTNRQSAKACRTCGGTGMRTLPHGQEGKRLANWLDECVEQARKQISSHLRFSQRRD